MTNEKIIEQTMSFVKRTLKGAEGGHDWFHTHRVYLNALSIAENEKVNPFIVGLGALLHDIADAKFHNGDESVGPKLATEFLQAIEVEQKVIDHVVLIIEHISFKSSLPNASKKQEKFNSLELQVIQDADRLDAIGAIGIARAFNYGGFKNRALHDPDVPPNLNMTKEQYKKSTGPTINHFYEKLLLLKDKMNTKAGKQLAKKRHQFMLDYLGQFQNEWTGNL